MTTSSGEITLIPPTDLITQTGQRMRIAGLDFEFVLAPDSEAPAETHWFIEQLKAVTAAGNCNHTMHKTYTVRGAPIRDPLAWSKYLEQTIQLWGERAEVMYGVHRWPSWGRERVREMLGMGRDGYRFINGETLRLTNHGLTPWRSPSRSPSPSRSAGTGRCAATTATLNNNVKATYVYQPGWFDGNPANLHTHPPEAAAERQVAFMGGVEAVLDNARGHRRGGLPSGSPRSSTTWCSQIPTTGPRESSGPMRSSSSATRPSRDPGETST